jgi:hypothetical protein
MKLTLVNGETKIVYEFDRTGTYFDLSFNQHIDKITIITDDHILLMYLLQEHLMNIRAISITLNVNELIDAYMFAGYYMLKSLNRIKRALFEIDSNDIITNTDHAFHVATEINAHHIIYLLMMQGYFGIDPPIVINRNDMDMYSLVAARHHGYNNVIRLHGNKCIKIDHDLELLSISYCSFRVDSKSDKILPYSMLKLSTTYVNGVKRYKTLKYANDIIIYINQETYVKVQLINGALINTPYIFKVPSFVLNRPFELKQHCDACFKTPIDVINTPDSLIYNEFISEFDGCNVYFVNPTKCIFNIVIIDPNSVYCHDADHLVYKLDKTYYVYNAYKNRHYNITGYKFKSSSEHYLLLKKFNMYYVYIMIEDKLVLMYKTNIAVSFVI